MRVAYKSQVKKTVKSGFFACDFFAICKGCGIIDNHKQLGEGKQ